MKINDLTVFLITTGKNPNYSDCLSSLQNQSIEFNFDIIREYSPLSVAFQQMIERCKTKYYIEVDEDMVLNTNAIENLYSLIVNSNYAMICCQLYDVHYEIPIRGIKIYNHDIFKKYPYNLNHPSCEVEQLKRITDDGYKWDDNAMIVGNHSPKWTTDLIFERYNNLVNKQKLLGGNCGFGNIPQTLSTKLANNFNSIDYFALLGATSVNSDFNSEKNYTAINPMYKQYKELMPHLIKEYHPINILFLYDVDGWVFDFETRNYKKYSSHNIIRKKFSEITKEDLKNIQILIIPGSCHYKSLQDRQLIQYAQKQDIKIVVQYNSEIELDLIRPITNCDLAVASSPNILSRLKAINQKNAIFFPHFVDCSYWENNQTWNNFTIGWAGNKNEPVKNFSLLSKLNFPIKVQSDWGDKFFVSNRSLNTMKEFYNSIDVLLMISKTEGSPMVILEAMASRKLVLATNTGIAELMLPKQCIIDKSQNIVQQVNDKLSYFQQNSNLIKEIGQQNYEKVNKELDWFKRVNDLDKIYIDLLQNKKSQPIIKNQPKKIKVVQLARIPCANSGYYLSQLINDYSEKYESRYILGNDYSGKHQDIVPFRKFPTDLFWQTQKEKCINIIKDADILHIHHGFWTNTNEMKKLFKNKKVITTIYDLSLINNTSYFTYKASISQLLTVADQTAQIRTFGHLTPYYLPLINCLFNELPKENNAIPTVVFAPTNRYPITNNSSKGYYEVLEIINKLKDENLTFDFDLIEGVPHLEDLKRKRKADIIIDDIINDTFHNTSIHAACFGAISLTGSSSPEYPFIATNLKTLEEKLRYYIAHPIELKEEQNKLTEWRKTNYTPEKLLIPYENIYNKLLKTNTKYLLPSSLIEMTFFEIASLCEENNIKLCLLKNTCVQIVDQHTLKNNTLFFGVSDISRLEKLLSNNKFIKKSATWTKNNTTIILEPFPLSTKSWAFKSKNVYVPFPVIPYVQKHSKG